MCTDLFPKFLPLFVKNRSTTVRARDGGDGSSARRVWVADGDGLCFIMIVSYDTFC
jgi:hypothetical protein